MALATLKNNKICSFLLILTLAFQPIGQAEKAPASKDAPLLSIQKFGSFRLYDGSGGSRDLNQLLQARDQKILIYIQDAHGNISVQKNTARLLNAFTDTLKISAPWIGLEGTPSGEVDHRALSLFPNRRLRRLAALFFLKNGDLDGAEYYAAAHNPHARLFGVDSTALWAENKKHFNDFQIRGAQTSSLEKINAALTALKQAVYHRDLLELDHLFRKDESLAKDLRTLVQIAKAKGLSLKKFPAVAALTSRTTPDAENRTFAAQDRLIETLWDEVQTLRQKTWEASFLNPEQAQLYAAAEALLLVEKLLAFKAIPQEVSQLTAAPAAQILTPLQKRLRQYAYLLPRETRPQTDDFAALADAAEKALLFYATARARDHVLAENLEALVRQNPGSVSFFIGGGFHQARLVKQMLSKKISVVLVSPFMANHEGEKKYWQRLRDQTPAWPMPAFYGQLTSMPHTHAGSTLKLPSSFPLLGQPAASRFPWEVALVLYALGHTPAAPKQGAAAWDDYAVRWEKIYPQDSLTAWLAGIGRQTPGWFEYHGPSGANIVLGVTRDKAPRPAKYLTSLNRHSHVRLAPNLSVSVYRPGTLRSEMRSQNPDDQTLVGAMHTKEVLIQHWAPQEQARITVAGFLSALAVALYGDPKFNLKKAPLKTALSNIFLSVPSKQQNAVYDKFRERYAGVTLETNTIFSELLTYENPVTDNAGAKQTPTLKIAPHILTRTLSVDAAAASVTLEVLTALLVFWEMVVPILSELKIAAQAKDIHTVVTGIFTALAKQSGVTQAKFMADLATLSSQNQAGDHSDTHFASIIHTILDLSDQNSLMRPLPPLLGNSTIDRLVPLPEGARLDPPHTAPAVSDIPSATASPLPDYEAALVSSFGTPAPLSSTATEPAYTILGGKVPIAQNAVITLNGVKYKLIRPLGKGGFGEVWLVQKEGHASVKLYYALKVVKPPASQTTSPEFIRAARRAALEVSSLIRLEEVTGTPKFIAQEGLVDETNEPIPGVLTGSAEGLLLMSLASGQTLSRAVTSLKNQGLFLEPKDAATLMHNVSKAIAQAHTLGLVHRDLKPDNVMLRFIRQGHDWQHQILDWGLSRDEHTNRDIDIDLGVLRNSLAPDEQLYLDTLTKAGQVFGTPGYIGPNQIRNPHSVTYLDDIFALGATFYFMVTGGREIYRIGSNAPNSLERITRSLQGLYQNPSTHNPALEGTPLEYIILKMLAPPSGRSRHDKRQVLRVDARGNELLAYRSDDELLADLNALVEGRHLPSANTAGLTGYPDAYTVRILGQDEKTVYDDFIPPPDMLQSSPKGTPDSGSGQSSHSATSQTGTTPKSGTSRSRSTTHSLTEFLSRVPRQAPTQSIGGGPTLPLEDSLRSASPARRRFLKISAALFAGASLMGILFFFLWPLKIQPAAEGPVLLRHDQTNARVDLTVNGRPLIQTVTLAEENPGYGKTESIPVQVSVPWHTDKTILIPFKRLHPPPAISGIREQYVTKDRTAVAVDLVVGGVPRTIHQSLKGLIPDQDGTFEIPIKVHSDQGGEAEIKIKVVVDTTLFKWPANYFTLIEGYHEVKNPFEVEIETGGKKEKKSIQGEIHALSWLQEKGYIRAADDISFLSIYKQDVHPNDENRDGKPQFPFFFRDASHTANNPYTVSWMIVNKPIPASEKTHLEFSLDVRVAPKRPKADPDDPNDPNSDEALKKLGLDPGTYRGAGNILFGLHNPDASFTNQNNQAEYGKMTLIEASGMAGNLETAPLFLTPKEIPFNLNGGRGDFIRTNYAKQQIPNVSVPVNKWQTITLVKPAAGETYAAPGDDVSKAKVYDGKTALLLLEGRIVHTFQITVGPNMHLVLYSSGDTGGAAFGNAKVTLEEKKAPAAKRSELRHVSVPQQTTKMPALWRRIVPSALASQASAVLFLPARLMTSVTGPNLLPMPNTRLVFVAEPGLSAPEFHRLNTRLRSEQAVLIRSPRPFTDLLKHSTELENLKSRAAPALGVRIQDMGTPIFFNPETPQAAPVRQTAHRASEKNFFVLHVDALRLAKDPAYRTAHLVTAAALSKQTLQLLQGLMAYADGSLGIPPSWVESLGGLWKNIQILAYSA